MQRVPRVYLAGWGIFRRDAPRLMAERVARCRALGLEGLDPLSSELPEEADPAALSRAINQGNLALLRSADAVVADLNPFRGFEPDSGTVFECGFAVARGIPVFGYLDDARPLLERYRERHAVSAEAAAHYDADGLLLEEFGNPLNLMLAENIHLFAGDFDSALRACHAALCR